MTFMVVSMTPASSRGDDEFYGCLHFHPGDSTVVLMWTPAVVADVQVLEGAHTRVSEDVVMSPNGAGALTVTGTADNPETGRGVTSLGPDGSSARAGRGPAVVGGYHYHLLPRPTGQDCGLVLTGHDIYLFAWGEESCQ